MRHQITTMKHQIATEIMTMGHQITTVIVKQDGIKFVGSSFAKTVAEIKAFYNWGISFTTFGMILINFLQKAWYKSFILWTRTSGRSKFCSLGGLFNCIR